MGPEVLAGVGIASAVGGGGLQIFSDILGGEASSGKLKYQAGMSRMNAMINRQNADMERTIGEREAAKSGMKTGLTLGKITTAQAAQGGLVDSGSNADVSESQHAIGLLDQATIRNSAARRAYAYDVKAAEDDSSSKMFEMGAKNAKTASYIKAASSLLGTAGSVAAKWTDAKKHGMYSESMAYEEDNKYGGY